MSEEALKHLKSEDNMDCSPRFEAIVGLYRIIDVWVYSNAEAVIFHCAVLKTADGRAHWLEDGAVKKGDTVEEDAFYSYDEAMKWVAEQHEKIITQIYGGTSNDKPAV